MATVKSARKSSRLTASSRNESKVDESTTSQSRITEYLNVRKRGPGRVLDSGKKVLEAEATFPVSATSTPVKIKRLPRSSSSVLKHQSSPPPTGMLTPSPSQESINCEKVPSVEVVQEKPVSSIPAYKRFAHLIETSVPLRNQKPKLSDPATSLVPEVASQTTEAPVTKSFKSVPWLPLNEKWSLYDKLLFNVDSLCVLSAGRSQPCLFHKIQKTLENVLGRQVPIDQLERLNTIWPEAYEYRGATVIMQGKRIDSVAINVPGLGDSENSAKLLNDRREEVKGRVQRHLIDAHENFLLRTTKTDLKGEIPKQWHPDFNQTKVNDISRTPLLQDDGKSGLLSDKETPKFIQSLLSTPTKIPPTDTTHNTTTEPSVEDSKKKLSLLERIRAKEADLKLHKVLDTKTSRMDAILSQMDRFVQSVMFTFSSSRKSSLFLTDLTEKLIQSSTIPLNSAEVLERIKLLERAAPEWIKLIENPTTDAPRHVKILEKGRSLNSLLDCIKALKGKDL